MLLFALATLGCFWQFRFFLEKNKNNKAKYVQQKSLKCGVEALSHPPNSCNRISFSLTLSRVAVALATHVACIMLKAFSANFLLINFH